MKKAKNDLFHAIETANRLKHRKRKGWMLRGVKNPESVAEHSWRSGLIALAIAPKGYNKGKIAQLALLHDIGEIFGTDFSPLNKISKEKKEKSERTALKKYLGMIPSVTAKEWEALYNEMESQSSKEAKIVKDADILDMLFQALEYQQAQNYKKDLTEFWARDIKRLTTKPGKKLGKQINDAWPKKAKKAFDGSKYHYHY